MARRSAHHQRRGLGEMRGKLAVVRRSGRQHYRACEYRACELQAREKGCEAVGGSSWMWMHPRARRTRRSVKDPSLRVPPAVQCVCHKRRAQYQPRSCGMLRLTGLADGKPSRTSITEVRRWETLWRLKRDGVELSIKRTAGSWLLLRSGACSSCWVAVTAAEQEEAERERAADAWSVKSLGQAVFCSAVTSRANSWCLLQHCCCHLGSSRLRWDDPGEQASRFGDSRRPDMGWCNGWVRCCKMAWPGWQLAYAGT